MEKKKLKCMEIGVHLDVLQLEVVQSHNDWTNDILQVVWAPHCTTETI